MTQLVMAPTAKAAARTRLAQASAEPDSSPWSFLGYLGMAFVAVGLTDLALAWFPLAFGNPQWEFGTASAVLDGIPVFGLGLAMLLTSALVSGNRALARGVAVVCCLVAATIVGLGILYVTVVPLALQSVPDPTVRAGLIKAIIKTTVQTIAYTGAFLWIGLRAFKITALTEGAGE